MTAGTELAVTSTQKAVHDGHANDRCYDELKKNGRQHLL